MNGQERTQQALAAYVNHHDAFFTWTGDSEAVIAELLTDLKHLVGLEVFAAAQDLSSRYFAEETDGKRH